MEKAEKIAWLEAQIKHYTEVVASATPHSNKAKYAKQKIVQHTKELNKLLR